MWRMPFCMRGQCRPVLQRCGARCKLPSAQLTVERMLVGIIVFGSKSNKTQKAILLSVGTQWLGASCERSERRK